MASTASSKTTSTTKVVKGKTIKTTTSESLVVSTTESISLNKNKKKALHLISELRRVRLAITDHEKEKESISAEIYELMGYTQKLIDGKKKWQGEATKGLIDNVEAIAIAKESRTDVNKGKLKEMYPEIFSEVSYIINITKLLPK